MLPEIASAFLIECITLEYPTTFHILVQDKGVVGLGEPEYDSMKSKFFKSADNRKYKGIWQLAKLYVDKLKVSLDRFPRYFTLKNAMILRLSKILVSLFLISVIKLMENFAWINQPFIQSWHQCMEKIMSPSGQL